MVEMFDNNEGPLISVIVPVYNAEDTIERCLNSSLGGGYKNIELIVVNDGSTDSTEEIVRCVAAKDDRVVLISQENQGPGGSRDTGLANAHGDFLASCDSDDWYEPGYLAELLSWINESNADVAICRAQIPGQHSDYKRGKKWVWEGDEILYAFLGHEKINGCLWNKLIRRELFEGIRFDKSLWYGEDVLVVWRVLQRAHRVVRVEEPLYNFYVHEGSMCAKPMNEKRLYASFKVMNGIVASCEGTRLELRAKQLRYGWLFADLRLMMKDGYRDTEYEKRIQCYLREGGLGMLMTVSPKAHQAYALLCITSLPLARLVYRMAGKLSRRPSLAKLRN